MHLCNTRRFNCRMAPVVVFYLCLIFTFSGCGGGGVEQPNTGENGNNNPATNNTQQNQTKEPAGSSGSSLVTTDPEKGKMIDGIPYDVWFKDPLAVAAENKTLAAIPGTQPDPTPAKPTEPTPEPKSTTAEISWDKIIPAEVLSDEVKKTRNRFTSNLRSVGEYNNKYIEFDQFCASLAVLAQVASLHPGDITWKKNAPIVRDLSAKMVSEKLIRGAKSYRVIKAPFEQMVDALSGSPPGDIEKPDPETTFSDVASMGMIMKRIDALSKDIKSTSGNADSLKENSEDIRHQAYVLATIMKAMNTEGYGYFDDESFLEFSNTLSDNAVKMAVAAEAGEFDQFESAQSKVFQSCTICHNKYRD